MTEQRKRRIVTPHSDENPELSQSDSTGEPLAAYCDDGSPSDALSQREKKPFNYVLQPGETVVYEDTYIPPED
jgi:hypothetical protein